MPDHEWLRAALEEYKALRAESLTAMANQQSALRFGTAAVGVALGFALGAQQAEARFWALSCLVPILSLVFFAFYAIEFGRMVRVGKYILHLEAQINSAFSDPVKPLGWERWLDRPIRGAKPRLPFYWAAPILFMTATTFSTLMAYVFRTGGPFCPQGNTSILLAMWFLVVALIARIMFSLRSLRERYDKYFDVS